MREASCFSQHGDVIGCSLSPYYKFEITLELFAIWLVAMKLSRQSDYEIYFWVVVPSKKRERPAVPHSMVMQLDVHSIHIASLKLI